MKRVIHFEISSSDPGKTIEFYSTIFGWNITRSMATGEEYYLIHTGSQHEKGINGGMKRRGSKSFKGTVNTIGVEDIKKMTELVSQNGGKLLEGIKSLAGTGYLAYCEDPDGTVFAMLEYNSDAK